MKPLHIETPLFESRPLSIRAGRSVWLKFDALQPPGSFKIRGKGLACQEYVRRGARRLISSSGGNAGIAVAYAGRHLAVPVLVVVPETTSDRAKGLIRREGADSLAQSIRAEHLIELPAITSLATTLGASKVCQQAFDWSRDHPLRSVVVSDRAAVSACQRFVADHHVLVEPACGASLAVAHDSATELEDFESVLIIVCGGVTATIEQLEEWST